MIVYCKKYLHEEWLTSREQIKKYCNFVQQPLLLIDIFLTTRQLFSTLATTDIVEMFSLSLSIYLKQYESTVVCLLKH
jgi:hypothetical protein